MSKVVHFEIPADDTNRAKEFWSGIFGIEWQSYDGPVEYYMFSNDDQQSGGGLMPRDSTVSPSTSPWRISTQHARRCSREARWRKAPCRAWAGSPTPRTPKATRSRCGRTTRTRRPEEN